jgi:low temperature requirement protein LtrA
MRARATDEEHRVSTPLELIFDLTFVVAVAHLAAELARSIEAGDAGSGYGHYLMVFFAIWWAWINFTWFASAYDTDDVPYRLLTLLQMGGVLVLAAGVPAAFEHADFRAVTAGYVVMRVAMFVQWLRAARSDPASGVTARRYAFGTVAVQCGWLLRLLLPDPLGFVGFLVLVVAELAMPLWAQRKADLAWHPHHIAERYGLFTIIVLGECVLASSNAVAAGLSQQGLSGQLVLVAAGGLLLLFGLWWMYFLKPAGLGLERQRRYSFWWGYGHYLIFAALAALGAGIEVNVAALSRHGSVAAAVLAAAAAGPVAVFVVTVWALHAPLFGDARRHGPVILLASLAVLALAALTVLALPMAALLPLLSLPVAFLVVQGMAVYASPRSTSS